MTEEKTKTISLKEFKMWLEGVEEMQADGWVPDARQWQRIRDKIDSIKEEQVSSPAFHYAPGVRGGPATGTAPFAGAGASNVELPPGSELVFQPMNPNPPSASGTDVPVPSSLNAAHPAANPARPPRQATTASGMPVTLAGGRGTNPQVPVKTPDIDTSHGKDYNSQFV